MKEGEFSSTFNRGSYWPLYANSLICLDRTSLAGVIQSLVQLTWKTPAHLNYRLLPS